MRTITVNVSADIDVADVFDELTDEEIREEYLLRFDKSFDFKQQIIDIVFNNDKKTALQELESLFGGMYTWWEKV